ncbi:MAG: S-layer homology domain-containing protein [Bacillota bacterium]|nr:S-layer homology domain-containing protein [Bacillota bacterium]
MVRKRIAVLLVFCMLLLPLSAIQASSLSDKLQRIENTIEKLSALSTTEVEDLLLLFEQKAETGYTVMFDATEKDNLTNLGVTPTSLKDALAAFRIQYVAAFPQKITTDISDLFALADILENIRANHFEVFREAAKSEGQLELDIFVELLLSMATLELDTLYIPQSVSDNWFNTLKLHATDETVAVNFLSDHGVRLSKLNTFFDALSDTDKATIEGLFKKAGIIKTEAPISGGGGSTPPLQGTFTYAPDAEPIQSQINDPDTTEIVLTLPATAAAERIIEIPVSLVSSASTAEKPFVIHFGNVSMTLPPGFIPQTSLTGTTSIALAVSIADDIPVPADMTKKGQVFDFTLTVNTGSQETPVTTFTAPVSVTIPVAELNVIGHELEKLGLYRYNGNQWSYIGGIINKLTSELTATLNSFSKYRVMLYSKTFTDIADHWAQTTIELLASRHLVFGMTESTFEPETSLTRAQTATLLVRALGLQPTSANKSFTDVEEGAWYYSTVLTAAQAGLVTGYPDGTFMPDQIVSRQEFTSMVARAVRYAGQTNTLTEEQVDQILDTYTDGTTVSDWARTEMAYAVNLGLITGFPDNTIQPTGTSTRAQGTAILERMLRKLNKI